jgi:hypothetical protein
VALQLQRPALSRNQEVGTAKVLLEVRSDVERHFQTSGHNPILEAITALVAVGSKKLSGVHAVVRAHCQ